jgi:Domain of unknown function (DUF4398)
MRVSLLASIAAVLAIAGCASGGLPPTEQMTAARVAVGQAANEGAAEHATVEFAEARRKLEQATREFERERYARARRLAEQAEADAVLAQAKARSASANSAAAQVERDIKALREELRRKGQSGG